MAALGAALATMGVGVLVWAAVIEPRLLDRVDQSARLPNLPRTWHGERVALIADPQVGMWLANTETVRRAVRTIISERPALALIAGDFIYAAAPNTRREVAVVINLIRPLPRAGIPTHAVLGNHDYAARTTDELRAALEAAGVRVLDNEAVPAPEPDGGAEEPLYVVGIAAHTPDADRPVAAIERVPRDAARIVVMHNPASFPPLPSGSAPLAVAGHTHGGQVRVPFAPSLTPARLMKPWPEYRSGWIDGYGKPGNRLYVNRGIGFSLLPLRFGAPPELTFFTLLGPHA